MATRNKITKRNPIFGEITLRTEEWLGQVRLPSFAGFDTLALESAIDRSFQKTGQKRPAKTAKEIAQNKRTQEGLFCLTIHDESADGPVAAQEQALTYLLQNETRTYQAVIDAIIKYYEENYNEWRRFLSMEYPSDLDDLLPKSVTAQALRKLLRLEGVTVHESSKQDVSYVGFAFSCSWDQEHGAGVLMHKASVVQVGHMDEAIDPYVE